MTYRHMAPDDVEAVFRLAEVSEELQTGTSNPQFWDRPTMLTWAASGADMLFVCDIDGVVAGFLICSFNPNSKSAYLHTIVVGDAYRSRGIGTAMMCRLEQELVAAGCIHVFGLVKPDNLASNSLFHKSGYLSGTQFTYWEKYFGPCKHEST